MPQIQNTVKFFLQKWEKKMHKHHANNLKGGHPFGKNSSPTLGKDKTWK
jgi:hypothetical protein